MSKRARTQRDKRAEADAVNQSSQDSEDDQDSDFWREIEDQPSPQHSGLSFYGN